ncbi:MAG TPA: transaldolase [Solirubrobacteraceae bacterium]|nr:transaldolase [Solirubrobacteraceae bacterium]
MNALSRLAGLGTSVWVDGLVPPAELERLVREDSVSGLTSNPTIFRAAVLGEQRYAARIAALGDRPAEALYETLATEDVRAAADVLAPDGHVSLEVAPALADDADATVAAARDLWARLERPNAMIKIPATPAGVDAIRRVTADGIGVNVTLLFGLDAHAAVMGAYVAGLEERLRRGRPVDHVASVASFFVSRVDTAVDRLLADRGRDDLAGRAAVANARLAYAGAAALFGGERFTRLRRAGARPQRLLWASTGTKDPRYSDVKYVEQLAGPGVVNTMPPATLAAFRDHGQVRDALTGSAPAARATLADLAAAGVDLDAVTARLLDEGIAAFAASMDELLGGLAPAAVEA